MAMKLRELRGGGRWQVILGDMWRERLASELRAMLFPGIDENDLAVCSGMDYQ